MVGKKYDSKSSFHCVLRSALSVQFSFIDYATLDSNHNK